MKKYNTIILFILLTTSLLLLSLSACKEKSNEDSASQATSSFDFSAYISDTPSESTSSTSSYADYYKWRYSNESLIPNSRTQPSISSASSQSNTSIATNNTSSTDNLNALIQELHRHEQAINDLNQQKKYYTDFYNKQIEMMKSGCEYPYEPDDPNYKTTQSKLRNEVNKLKVLIAQFRGNLSMSEQKKVMQLKKELAEKEEALNKLEIIHTVNEQVNSLQSGRDTKIAEIDEQIKQENILYNNNYDRLTKGKG